MICAGLSCTQSQQGVENGDAKILSLYPAITETIFYVQGEALLCGRSDYCSAPPQVKDLPSFGTSLTPNYEAIARQKPKVILTDKSSGTPVDKLQRIAPIQQLPWLSIEDMKTSIVELGTLLQKEEEAKKLAQKLGKALTSRATVDAPTMLLLMGGSDVSKGQLWFMRKGTIHGAVIEAAGYRNAAPDSLHGPPSMSLEQLIQQDPDFIIFLTTQPVSSSEEQKMIQAMDVMETLQSVQKKQVGVISGDNLMGVGPSVIELVTLIKNKGQSLADHK